MPDQVLDFLTELILGKGLTIALVSFIIGQFIKNKTKIDNANIPIMVAVVGAIVAGITNQWTLQEESLVMAATDGFIIGGFTTGLYEMLRKNEKFASLFCSKVDESETKNTEEL